MSCISKPFSNTKRCKELVQVHEREQRAKNGSREERLTHPSSTLTISSAGCNSIPDEKRFFYWCAITSTIKSNITECLQELIGVPVTPNYILDV
uniref:Uncharacterized protein n=1 Tax=Romanomermis culicivorax TaxID=13658 RepID=A0A915J9B4_ROMCU